MPGCGKKSGSSKSANGRFGGFDFIEETPGISRQPRRVSICFRATRAVLIVDVGPDLIARISEASESHPRAWSTPR